MPLVVCGDGTAVKLVLLSALRVLWEPDPGVSLKLKQPQLEAADCKLRLQSLLLNAAGRGAQEALPRRKAGHFPGPTAVWVHSLQLGHRARQQLPDKTHSLPSALSSLPAPTTPGTVGGQ